MDTIFMVKLLLGCETLMYFSYGRFKWENTCQKCRSFFFFFSRLSGLLNSLLGFWLVCWVCAVRACIKQFNRSRMCFTYLLFFFPPLISSATLHVSASMILFFTCKKKIIIDKSLDRKYLNPITFTAFLTPFSGRSRSHIIWISIKLVEHGTSMCRA